MQLEVHREMQRLSIALKQLDNEIGDLLTLVYPEPDLTPPLAYKEDFVVS